MINIDEHFWDKKSPKLGGTLKDLSNFYNNQKYVHIPLDSVARMGVRITSPDDFNIL